MLFTQPVFFLFFAVVFAVHWTAGSNSFRKIWLLLASTLFYGAWDYRFLGLIFLSITIDYFAGLLIGGRDGSPPRKIWLVISLCANLGILGFFKYFNFFVDSAVALLRVTGAAVPDSTLSIILPVGVSFYTFQSMSYTIDVYRGILKPVRSPLDFALFVMFFPQLVAGPIVRATDFLPQLDTKRSFRSVDFRFCFSMFLVGFFKKACIADNLAMFADQFFQSPESYGSAAAWFSVFCYTVQIYCDFSGYTDMAIAAAGLLGYELTENFRHPYFAASITDFWRRWHMSLSTWLRDYLYVPLGGNRGSKAFVARNLMLTMVLGGLWHGAGWTFILWGAFHGFLLLADRTVTKPKPAGPVSALLIKGTGMALTFFFVMNAWVLFRATNLRAAGAVFARMYLPGESVGLDLPSGALAVIFLLLGLHALTFSNYFGRLWRALPDWAVSLIFAIAVLLLLPWISTQYKPFIYFQF